MVIGAKYIQILKCHQQTSSPAMIDHHHPNLGASCWQQWLQQVLCHTRWGTTRMRFEPALHFLGVNFRLGYQSEWEDHMQELSNITHSYIKHHEGRMFKDMTTRPRSRGAAHLLIATTPCPDFSTAGKHKGHVIIVNVSHYLGNLM